jgi:hypothetical protein
MNTGKIGSKRTLGGHNGPKRFTNGHKHYTASDAMELSQVLAVETRIATNFEKNKKTMTRARNPLTGEQTPRGDDKGILILPAVVPEPKPVVVKELTAKIGAHKQTPVEVKIASPVRDADRIKVLQNLHDDVTGELEYWRMKLEEREQRMRNSLLRNRLK